MVFLELKTKPVVELRTERYSDLENKLLAIYNISEKHWTAEGTEYVLINHPKVNKEVGYHFDGKIFISKLRTIESGFGFKELPDIIALHEQYEIDNPSISKPREFDANHLEAIDFAFKIARDFGKEEDFRRYVKESGIFSNERDEVLKGFLSSEDKGKIERAMDQYGIVKVWYAKEITKKAEHMPIVARAIAETSREEVINLFKNEKYNGRKKDLVFLLDNLGAVETGKITNKLDKEGIDNAIKAIEDSGKDKFNEVKTLGIYPFTEGCEILKKYDFDEIRIASNINLRRLKQNTRENIESTIDEIKKLDKNSKEIAENVYSKYGYAAPTRELAIIELALIYGGSLKTLVPKGYKEGVIRNAYELAVQEKRTDFGSSEIENIAKAIRDEGIKTTKEIYPMVTDSANISSVNKKIEELGLTLKDADKIYWSTKHIIQDIEGWDGIISKYNGPEDGKSLRSIIDLTKEWKSGQWRIKVGYILKASEYGNGLERARQAIELNAIYKNIIAIVGLLETENVTKEEFLKIKEERLKGVYASLIVGKLEKIIYKIRNPKA